MSKPAKLIRLLDCAGGVTRPPDPEKLISSQKQGDYPKEKPICGGMEKIENTLSFLVAQI